MSEVPFKLIKLSNGKEFPLTGDMLVGRNAETGLALTEGLASRRHAQLTLAGTEVWVEDLGSANGTYVNGARISTKAALKIGDRVRFDVEEFMLDGPPAPGVDPNATVFRGPAAAAVPKAQELVAEASGVYKRPGAWADPDSNAGGANKTKFIDPAEMKQMMNQVGKPEAVGRTQSVDTPALFIASGAAAGTKIKLQTGAAGGTEWSVGSSPEREVVLQDNGVSALHAKIVNDGQRWKVIDQMSANGTYVNGKRSNVSFLTAGDRLRFGPIECEFQLPTAGRAPEPATTSGGGGSKTALIATIAFLVTAIVLFAAWKLLK